MRSMLNETDGCGGKGERVCWFISTSSKGGGSESDPSES